MKQHLGDSHNDSSALARCERFLAAKAVLGSSEASLQHVPRTPRRLGRLPQGFSKRFGCIPNDVDAKQFKQRRKEFEQETDNEQHATRERQKRRKQKHKRRGQQQRGPKSNDPRRNNIHVDWELFPTISEKGNETVNESMEHYLEGLSEMAPNRRRQSITEMFLSTSAKKTSTDGDSVRSLHRTKERKRRSFVSKCA